MEGKLYPKGELKMLLKTIYCKVEEEKKELFSKAQEKWQAIQHLDGFHGQFGGWNEMRHVYSLYGKMEGLINHL